jgi:copper chaperone CopZ
MKKEILLVMLFALVTMFVTQEAYGQKKKEKETTRFYVEDMFCKNCQAKIEKNIAFEKGVADLKCNLEDKTVDVTYDASKTNPEKIISGFQKIKMSAVVVDNTKISEINQQK